MSGAQPAVERVGPVCAGSSESPLVVVWRISEQCGLACPFCGYSRELIRPRALADPAQVLAFGARLGAYAAATGRSVLVSWLGGEPLDWKPLAGLSRTFRHEFGLRVGVTTNGIALRSEAVRRLLVADYNEVTVSVDGIGVLHDRLRGAPGLFQRLADGVRALRKMADQAGAGPRLKVNTVLMRDNLEQFEALCVEVAAWGVEELTFNALGGSDRPEFHPRHRLCPEQLTWLRASLPGIRARVAPLGMRIAGSAAYLDRLEASAHGIAVAVANCAPGQRFLFIDERGVAAPCSFTGRGYGFAIDELVSPRDIERLPRRFAQRRQAAMLAPCRDCLSTQVFGKFELNRLPSTCATTPEPRMPIFMGVSSWIRDRQYLMKAGTL